MGVSARFVQGIEVMRFILNPIIMNRTSTLAVTLLSRALLVSFLAVLLPAFAWAQVNIPASAELPRLQDVLNALPAPKVVPQIITVPEPKVTDALAPDDAERIRFVLKTLTISGATVYTPDELLPLFENLTGQETSVAEIYKIAAKLTAKYRNDGYVLARAIVPPQDVTPGHVSLQVVEGRLNDIILVGDPALKQSNLVNSYAERLRSEGPFNALDVEQYLLLINDLPGVTAQSTLKPAAVVGESDLVIQLVHHDFDAEVNYNNWGTRFLGPRQVEGTATFNNVLPQLTSTLFGDGAFHDRLRVRGIQTTDLEELSFIDASYLLPLNKYGTSLEGSIYRGLSQPGLGLDALDIESYSSGWSLTLRQPLKRTRAATHNLFGAFDWKDTDVTAAGNTTSEDKLRVLRAGIDGTVADKLAGINVYRLELSQGLGILGASERDNPLASRQRGVPDSFFKTKLDLARLQRLNDSINLLVSGSGQFSSHALLAAEEFGVGGENYGRGYDNSEIIGDQGFAVKAELQYNFELNEKYLDHWQLFFFQDFGAVWNKDLGFGDEGGAQTLASNGFGARFDVGKTMTFDFTFANPTTRDVNSQGESGRNPTVFVRLRKRFSHNWDGAKADLGGGE